jgi:hypothetical protein
MIAPGSRYQEAVRTFSRSHLYNERGYPLLEGEQGKTSLHVQVAIRDTLYLVTTEQDPRVASLEYFIKDGEQLQFLAFKFFDDPRRWHELATLNPHVYYPLDFTTGDLIRVPT